MQTVDIHEEIISTNPFPGLRPFSMEESHLFFGREGQSDEVLLKLSKNRFVGVIGPSGSGKSSFVYCGVLPILYGGFLADNSPNWNVVVTRPGHAPIENLANALLAHDAEYLEAEEEEKKIKRTIYATMLRSSSLGLVEAIQQSRKKGDTNYLVLVDQFEELFRFKDSNSINSINETLAFVNLLMEAVDYPDLPIYVGITMRSDFIGDCAQFPELTRKINDSYYLIPQLTRDQKRWAIEGPVAVGGATISSRLTQQLLNDLGDNPDQLPILQHALMRTWSYWESNKEYAEEPVDLKHYEAIGTMSEALSMHANEAFDELNSDQQQLCEVLFKAITEKRGENFGIRRPTRLSEIAGIAEVHERDVIEVVEKFRKPGRSLLTPSANIPLASNSMIDISHESLMRIWVRLKNWVDDEAEAVQMYTRLAEASAMYQVGKAGLWRPPDLQLALNWKAKHKPTLEWAQRYDPAFERTMVFLEYSKKEFETEQRIKELEQKRKLQRARILGLVMGGALIICILFLIFAIMQRARAVESEKKAIEEKERSDSLRFVAEDATAAALLAEAAAVKAKDDAIKAQEAEALERERAEEQSRIAELRRLEAERNRQEALRERDRANDNANRADQNAAQAERNAEAERQAKLLADKRRYLSIAKAIAIKSKEINDNEQASILAQQGYNFNSKYEGYPFDNDIYNGLFFALERYDHPLTRSLQGHQRGAARALVTRTQEDLIYSGGSDGRIIRWQHKNGQWVAETLVTNPTYQIYSMDISNDGKQLVAAGLNTTNANNNYVVLYNLDNMSSKNIEGFVNAIENIEFTPDGKGFFARDNSGKSIKYSDLSTAKEVIKSTVKLTAIDLSPTGDQLAGSGDNGSLFTWDVKNNFAVREIKNLARALTSVSFTKEKGQLIIGDYSGQVKILNNGVIVRTLSGHISPVEQIKFNHKGNFMATASKDKTVRLWNLSQLNEQPIVLSDHHDWVWSIAFSPDDEQLLAGLQSTAETLKGIEETIHAWPTKIETMSNILCKEISRNMSKEEWDLYVGDDLTYASTCPNYPENYK